MKPPRTILVLVLLLALGGGLAWEFWPGENAAPRAIPSTPKTADASKPISTTVAAVEFPKAAPVKPSADSTANTTPPEDTQQLTRDATHDAIKEKFMQHLTLLKSAQHLADWGDVYFTDGEPKQFTLKDGSPVTITATIMPDGGVNLQIAIEKLLPNGKTKHMQIGGGGSPASQTFSLSSSVSFPGSDSDDPANYFTMTLTPHVH